MNCQSHRLKLIGAVMSMLNTNTGSIFFCLNMQYTDFQYVTLSLHVCIKKKPIRMSFYTHKCYLDLLFHTYVLLYSDSIFIYFITCHIFILQSVFDSIFLTFYNVTFTSLPVFLYGLFENHIPQHILLEKPVLYR